MNVEIRPASMHDHDTLLRNLWQFYMYEFSRFERFPTTPAGRFLERELDGVFTRPDRHPFLLYANGSVVGFAIVDEPIHSHYSGASNIAYMVEFFVMAAYQGRGIGEAAATRLFAMFPGPWEVYEMQSNLNAQRFWRKIIQRYTRGKYTEQVYPEQRGIVQSFISPHPQR